jgi:tetratricopeptide (TPR) repeat protein
MLMVAVLGFTSPPTYAANPDAEKQARRSFERAEAHFKAGLFAEALPEYQDGYEQLPLPGFLINIAQCQRRLGDLTQARATYRKFILIAPDSPYVPEVRSLVAEIDQLLEGGAGAAEAPPAAQDQLPTLPTSAAVAEPATSPRRSPPAPSC